MPEVELGVLDRLILNSVLPKEGNAATIRLVRKLREAASLSEEEIALIKFEVHEEGRIKWDEPEDGEGKKVPHMKAINVGPKMFADVIRILEGLDKEEKLTSDHIGLYEKFVERDTGNEEAKGPQKVVGDV